MLLGYWPHHATPTLGVVHFFQILFSFRQIIELCFKSNLSHMLELVGAVHRYCISCQGMNTAKNSLKMW